MKHDQLFRRRADYINGFIVLRKVADQRALSSELNCVQVETNRVIFFDHRNHGERRDISALR
ncbi:MAG: hypothetical protein KDE51_23550, partial [Anaerolineales bacterium]|nr:hypothetical protein [Anaerolineales bacterium]